MPHNEAERLVALKALNVLDTPADARFDRLTALASDLFAAPIALISLLDETRQWFKSSVGLSARETPRCWAFCDHAIEGGPDQVFVVPDATLDPAFAENPLVVGGPLVRFYAGAPLVVGDGHCVGTLCVIDTKPRSGFSTADAERLQRLAQIAVDELEMAQAVRDADERRHLLQMAETMSGVGHWRYNVATSQVAWSDEVYRIHGADPATFDPNYDEAVSFYPREDQDIVNAFMARAIERHEAFEFQLRITRRDGSLRNVVCKAQCELDEAGSTKAIYGVFQDITPAVETLEAVKRSEAEHRLLTENATDIIARYAPDGTFLYISPAIAAVLGYDPAEVIGRKTFDIIHADDHAGVTEQFRACARPDVAAGSVRIQYRALRKDGGMVWLEAHPKPIFNAAGRVVEFHDVVRDVTARREVEQRLQRSEARYRLLTENSSDLVIQMSVKGLLQYVSPSITEMLGYSPDEVLGRRGRELVHPDDIPLTRKAFLAARNNGRLERAQYRLRAKDGRTVWVEARPTAARDPVSGALVGVTDVIRDVTQRRHAELALIESRARYRLLADNASDIVTESDLDGRFKYVSPAVAAVTGYSPDEVIGRNALDFVHPEDRERVGQDIEAALSDPAGREIEHRHIRKDGRVIWVQSRPRLARDPITHRAFAVTDVMRDVTARKQVETALAQSEALHRVLADNISDTIARISLDGALTYLSPSVERLCGLSAANLVGRQIVDITHPDDAPALLAGLQRVRRRENRDGETIRYRLRHRLGHWIWVEANPTLFTNAAGAVEFVDVVRDITTQILLDDELRRAKLEAESAVRIKSEFLSNMSHELRTPLTSILGFGAILQREPALTEQGANALDRVNRSSQALLTIVNDILDFSKLESGHVEIDPQAVDPAKVLQDSLQLLEPQAAAKGVALAFVQDGEWPAAVAMDDGRVRQILLNLISNGLKFTAEGSVTLSAAYDADRGRLACRVIDTGAGIPLDRQDRLFKRFSQVDASTTRAFGGTGLGLAICKGLVEAMGGEIGVTSTPGAGACFWFELPCPIVAPPWTTAAGKTDAPYLRLAGLRVLVADDNPGNRELVRLLLTPYRVELTEAAGGDEAVRLANETPFDMILLDIRMPGMDGPTAARLIRRDSRLNRGIPLLAFTAEDAEGAAMTGWAGVFDGHLAKPIVPAHLFATLARWADPGDAEAPEAVATA